MNRSSVSALAFSAAALAAWVSFEGGIITEAYIPVPGDVPTIGAGHTEGVKLGDKITPERGMELAREDSSEAAGIVKRCVRVPLYQNEFDAYALLAGNIGPGHPGKDGFCLNKQGMKAVIPRRLEAKDYAGACEAILLYDKFKGKPMRGLTNRRRNEYRMCITDPAAAPSPDTGSIASARGSGL